MLATFRLPRPIIIRMSGQEWFFSFAYQLVRLGLPTRWDLGAARASSDFMRVYILLLYM